MHMHVKILLANDFENIDGQLQLSSHSAQQTAITLYEMKSALERYGISCTWDPQKPADTMTAKLAGMVSWAVIQEKIIEVPTLFTDRMPSSKVTLECTPTEIRLEIFLSEEAIQSLYQHGAPLFQ